MAGGGGVQDRRVEIVERELLRDCTPAVSRALAVLVVKALDEAERPPERGPTQPWWAKGSYYSGNE